MLTSFGNPSKKPRILVVGDLMIDHYIWGECERISPEAPVQVIDVKRESRRLGGACNVIHNLVSLDAIALPCGVVGDDGVGLELVGLLRELGVVTAGVVVQHGRATTKKSRVIASHQQVVRVDWESRVDISEESEELLIKYIDENLQNIDALVLSDYGKGVLTSRLCQEAIRRARAAKKPVLIDPKGRDYSKYRGATLLTPNKKEAKEASGIEICDSLSLEAALRKLKEMCELEYSLITLSEDGIGIMDREIEQIPTIAREVYDVTGAGDTVIASLAYGLALAIPLRECALFANAAAAVVVGKIGSATATHSEIAEYLHTIHQSGSEERILQRDSIVRIAEAMRNLGRKIVFTNGCFDILHAGHVQYLQKASAYGDCLIVGLNSDSSVKNLKGSSRPINSQDDRAFVLAALESVDYVVIFDEDTPLELIKAIRPDVLVKGGDYAGKEVVGSEIAKEVHLIEFLEGRSTSAVVKKIKG